MRLLPYGCLVLLLISTGLVAQNTQPKRPDDHLAVAPANSNRTDASALTE
jgi:hypothetical protein